MTEPLWILRRDRCGPPAEARCDGRAFAASGVSIDSRSLEPGDLFVALAGERPRRPRLRRRSFRAPGLRPPPWSPAPSAAAHAKCVVADALKALEALGRGGARTGEPRPARRRDHRLGGQDQRHPARSGRRPRPGRPGPRLSQVLQQPYRRASDPGSHAARQPGAPWFEVGMNHAGEIAPPVAPDPALLARRPSPLSGRCMWRTSPTGKRASPAPRRRSSPGYEPGGVARPQRRRSLVRPPQVRGRVASRRQRASAPLVH